MMETPEDFAAIWRQAEAATAAESGEPEATDEPAEEPSEAPAEAPTRPDKPRPKPAPKQEASAEEGDEEEPEEKADGKVHPKERIEFRQWKRREREKLQQHAARIQAELSAKEAEVSTKAERVSKLERAIESEDWDGVASVLGRKSWNELQREVVKRFQSPEYREVQELRRWKEEQEERKQREAEEQRLHGLRSEQAKKEAEYLGSLKGELAQLEGPAAALAEVDEDFVRLVFFEQKKEFDGVETIDVEEAAERALKLARRKYEFLRKAFGDQAASQPETPAGRGNPARNGASPRRKHVSQSRAAEASSRADWTDEQWQRHWSAELMKAEGR